MAEIVHYRLGRSKACGLRDGVAVNGPSDGPVPTEDLERVSCLDCVSIAKLAQGLADKCGCRRARVHLAVARAHMEIQH